MKRNSIVILLVLILSIAISGCSQSNGGQGTETGTKPAVSNDQRGSSEVLTPADEQEDDRTAADGSSLNGSTGEVSETDGTPAKDNTAGTGTSESSGAGKSGGSATDAVNSGEAGKGTEGSGETGSETSGFDWTEYSKSAKPDIAPDVAEGIIKQTADTVIRAIADKDFETVSNYTHPELGVRFTPYTCPSEERDLVFSKEMIKEFFDDKNTYVWGYYDGSGFDIELTPEGYYGAFIYPVDYVNVSKAGYNTVLSNTLMYENQFEFYRNSIIVEYYFPGSPEYDGMDWRSLRLVFQQYKDSWMLTGIINNQWTI